MKHDPEYIGTQPTGHRAAPVTQISGWCGVFGLHAEDTSYNCETYCPHVCDCPCHAGKEPTPIYP